MITANIALWDGRKDTNLGEYEFAAPPRVDDAISVFHDREYHNLVVVLVSQSGRNLSGEGPQKAYYTIRAERRK